MQLMYSLFCIPLFMMTAKTFPFVHANTALPPKNKKGNAVLVFN